MNVGIVTAWLERGNTYVSKALASALQSNADVHVFARGGEKCDVAAKHSAVRSVTAAHHLSPTSSVYVSPDELWSWVKEKGIDVLLFNEQTDWRIVASIQSWPILLGAYVDSYNHRTAKYFWLFDFLICNTERHFSIFKNHPQSWLVPWGTDTELFVPTERGRGAQAAQPIRFFHSCGFSPRRKGTDLIIEALKKTTADCKVIIHAITPLDTALRGYTDPRLEIVVKEVPAPGLYHLGDVYLYPTRSEGIGLTIAEALSCGLPVVTTDVPPANEFVRQGRNGVLLRVSDYKNTDYYWPDAEPDIDDLAEAISRLSANPLQVQELSLEARRDACERLDWKKNSASLPSLVANARRARSSRPTLSASVYAYSHAQAAANLLGQKVKSDMGILRIGRRVVRRFLVGR